MDKNRSPRHSHLFTVRLWLEELGAGQTEWRGKVQSVTSGEVRYFRTWSALIDRLVAMLPDAEAGQPPGSTDEPARLDDTLGDP
jgi:hypothetical protein